MHVTFTKRHNRYTIAVARERGPELAPRDGPGYDDALPHDAVHFIVEAEAGIACGVFGRIAAGRSNIFWAADPALRRSYSRKEKRRRPSRGEQDDMALSERLSTLGPPLWELKAGRRTTLPEWLRLDEPPPVPDAVLDRIVERLGDFAERWAALAVGGSITLWWPNGRPAVRAVATPDPAATTTSRRQRARPARRSAAPPAAGLGRRAGAAHR